jgi:hypothetical protein
MSAARKTLHHLRRRLESDGLWARATTLEIEEYGPLVSVRFHAATLEDVAHFFEALRAPEVAANLAQVRVSSEDDGNNGTRDFDLRPLLAGGQNYPALLRFQLERTKPAHHNRTIVTFDGGYEEGGGLGVLLDRAPHLLSLEAPSAPSPRFFERSTHALEELRISVGYDHQGFVRGLARTSCFPRLASLELVDSAETYLEDWDATRIPRAHWSELFASSALPALRRVRLVGTRLDDAAARALLDTPLGRQLKQFDVEASAC